VQQARRQQDTSKLPKRLAQLVGTTLAERYRLDDIVGLGAFGAVFGGVHLRLHRSIAVKFLYPRFSLDPELALRFDREAHVASGVMHPNCCPVIDYGTTDDGLKYLVMPFLEGRELSELLGRPLDPLRAIGYMVQILRGLKHAHDQGVVHRDLKPENIMVCAAPDGSETLKIMDFGIAKPFRSRGTPHITRVGMIPGTPDYMSPEHAKGLPLDGRADLYCAGLIFFEMLSGQPPFRGDDPITVMRKQVFEPTPALPAFVDDKLRAFVEELLAKDPDARFFDALGALQALEPIQARLREQLRPKTRWQSLWRRLGRTARPSLQPAAIDS